jgi:hypothetical protein
VLPTKTAWATGTRRGAPRLIDDVPTAVGRARAARSRISQHADRPHGSGGLRRLRFVHSAATEQARRHRRSRADGTKSGSCRGQGARVGRSLASIHRR